MAEAATRKKINGLARTEAARTAARRAAQEKRAEYLRERGWTVIPPDQPAPLVTASPTTEES